MRRPRGNWRAKAVAVSCVAASTLAIAVPAFGGSASATSTDAAAASASSVPVYLDTSYPFAERAADLVSRMTLAEKASQLSTSNAPAIPRLGVQTYAWYGAESQHGVYLLMANNNGQQEPNSPTLTTAHATSFPTGLSSSLTWDRDLMYQETGAISDELRGFLDKSLFGMGQNNLGPSRDDYGSLFTFSPTVNLQRDPRWGRNDEPFGEDPFLTGELGSAYVDGMQGKTMDGQLSDRRGYLKTVADGQALRDEQQRGRSRRADRAPTRPPTTPRCATTTPRSSADHRAGPRGRADDLLQRRQRRAGDRRHLPRRHARPPHLRLPAAT